MNILITGGNGYLGGILLEALVAKKTEAKIISVDIRSAPKEKQLPSVEYLVSDIRNPKMADILKKYEVDCLVHLAAIVNPGKNPDRDFLYDVEVRGTKNMLDAAAKAGVKKILVASSGAAYGYYADHPQWITEDCPIRGNEAFAYSYHKRLVEEMLAEYREKHPELAQVIFRIGTILGEGVNNQITALFERKTILALKGSDSPFVFIWDKDVAECFIHGIFSDKTGAYNVAGDGCLTIYELADLMNKKTLSLPPSAVIFVYAILRKLRLTQYGPEQIDFLRYRPVLDNRKLKGVFGYTPRKSSKDVFLFYLKAKSQ